MGDCEMWCTTCGYRVPKAEVTDDLVGCPKCGTKSIPCDPAKDFLIEVNWHELRILGIWAMNWAQSIKNEPDSDDPYEPRGTSAVASCRGILSRLERQAPDESPLTMGGEMRQLREAAARGEFGLKPSSVEAHGIEPEGFVQANGPGAVGFSKPLSREGTGS